MITFHPNCTLPSEAPAFVTAPNTRSTLGIIWSCLAILILCVWITLPLNVPPQVDPRTSREQYRRSVYLFMRKMKWMVLTLLAPEIIVGKAFSDASSAWHHGERLEQMAQEDGVPWTTAHTFFADMGGFELHFEDPDMEDGPENQGFDPGSIPQRISLDNIQAQSSPVPSQISSAANPEASQDPSTDPVDDDDPPPAYVGSDQQIMHDGIAAQPLISLDSITVGEPREQVKNTDHGGDMVNPTKDGDCKIEIPEESTQESNPSRKELEEIFRKFPGPEMERLSSHGKTHWTNDAEYSTMAEDILPDIPNWEGTHQLHKDAATNLSALQGKIWVLCARQIIKARELEVIDKLPDIRKAELDDKDKTVNFMKWLCIIQIGWLITELSSRLKDGKPCSQLEVATLAFAFTSIVVQFIHRRRPHDTTVPFVVRAKRATKEHMKEIANCGPSYLAERSLYTLPSSSLSWDPFCLGTLSGGSLFGAIHLIAWKFVFPTDGERLVWKVSSLFIVSFPVTFALSGVVMVSIQDRVRQLSFLSTSLVILMTLLYILARLFLLFEPLRSLYFLPPESFIATWAENFPHMS